MARGYPAHVVLTRGTFPTRMLGPVGFYDVFVLRKAEPGSLPTRFSLLVIHPRACHDGAREVRFGHARPGRILRIQPAELSCSKLSIDIQCDDRHWASKPRDNMA